MGFWTGLVLAFLGQGPSAESRQGEENAALASVALELDSLNQGIAPEAVARHLQALGAAPILAALSRDELPLAQGVLVLGERERSCLLGGARLLGRAPFGSLWQESVSSPDPRARLATVELIGILGGASDLPLAILAVTPAADTDRLLPGASSTLEHAADELLRREPTTLGSLRATIAHTPPCLADALIRAIANRGGAEGLASLVDLLGRSTSLDLSLLSQIARVSGALKPPFPAAQCARVRAYLDDADRQLVRAAAMTLAQLQDPEAVPALLRLASQEDAVLSGAAFLALERITALDLPRRAERWQAWFAAELAWRRDHGQEVLAALRSQHPLEVVAALRTLAQHRLDRPSLAACAADCLKHADQRVRAEACRTLAQLRYAPAVEGLDARLDDPSPQVVAAATQALRSLGVTP
jgi:HEAT repeat protein